MSAWIDIDEGHRVQLLADGGVLWEHPTLPGYANGDYPILRHQVSPKTGAAWTAVQREPLTLSPSLHCDPALGGCGMHGFIRDGRWS
jgi:hypothetical protein